MPILLQIALGGAAGSLARYGAVTAGQRLFGANLPWGTLLVNVSGCFLIGLAFAFVSSRADLAITRFAPLAMPGFLGGFTTFSAFSLEALQLLERGRLVLAAAYVGASVALCLLAVAAGAAAARAGLAS